MPLGCFFFFLWFTFKLFAPSQTVKRRVPYQIDLEGFWKTGHRFSSPGFFRLSGSTDLVDTVVETHGNSSTLVYSALLMLALGCKTCDVTWLEDLWWWQQYNQASTSRYAIERWASG